MQMIVAIPAGKVTTYGELAKALSSSSRAVGQVPWISWRPKSVRQWQDANLLISLQALRRNPFAPEVPCHRIVKTTLNIGGFSGTQASQQC